MERVSTAQLKIPHPTTTIPPQKVAAIPNPTQPPLPPIIIPIFPSIYSVFLELLTYISFSSSSWPTIYFNPSPFLKAPLAGRQATVSATHFLLMLLFFYPLPILHRSELSRWRSTVARASALEKISNCNSYRELWTPPPPRPPTSSPSSSRTIPSSIVIVFWCSFCHWWCYYWARGGRKYRRINLKNII